MYIFKAVKKSLKSRFARLVVLFILKLSQGQLVAFSECPNHPDLVGIMPILLANQGFRFMHDRDKKIPILNIWGAFLWGKILIQILNPKTDFLFLWQNPKKDYESNESIRDEDSMD